MIDFRMQLLEALEWYKIPLSRYKIYFISFYMTINHFNLQSSITLQSRYNTLIILQIQSFSCVPAKERYLEQKKKSQSIINFNDKTE